MKQLIIALLLATTLAACGIKGSLTRPSDIPAYEAKKQKHNGSL